MIIDFHQHPYPGVHEFMEQQHITMSVLLPGPGGNEVVLAWAKRWPDKFIPFYWIENLEDTEKAADDLEVAVREKGHKGIKFQPLRQKFRMNEKRMWPIYARAEKLGIPVLFHTGVVGFKDHWAEFANPVYIDAVAEAFPNLKIVIAHMGGNYHYEALVIAEKHENVYMDTAYLWFFCNRMLPKIQPIDLIRRAVEFAGPHKVLYAFEGTPTSVIIDSDLEMEHKKRILWQNAKELLGLPEPRWAALELDIYRQS